MNNNLEKDAFLIEIMLNVSLFLKRIHAYTHKAEILIKDKF